MKKNLRLLCLGLAAATFTCGFAQDDMTSSLKNADMENGLKGWAIEGEQVLGKNSKDINGNASRTGFHGMDMGVHEAWNSNPENPLGSSLIRQRLRELPAGTYVFGAYVGAAKQTRGQAASNRDSIFGVSLFANDSVIPVATDNPDLGYKYKWGHSSKFNVAVTLADTGKLKGYLDVGLRVGRTNANYVVWDNATLYYFGSKSEAEALDAMAEIDMANAVLANDTVKNLHMNADSLANLTAAFKKANDATTTAATLWNDSEELFWAIALARRSANDYKNLAKNIEVAEKVASITAWTSDDIVALLKETIDEAETAYTGQKANRAEINTLNKKLSWYAADVKYDSLMIAEKALRDFIAAAKPVENQKDGYTTAQIASLEAYQTELKKLMAEYDADFENANDVFENREIDPNTLVPYIQKTYDAIEEVKSHPFDGVVVWSKLLNRSATALDSRHPIEGTVKEGDLFVYTSEMFEFTGPVKVVRLTVNKSAYDQKFFSLSALEFYDKDGKLIALTASDISSNADHNSLPGNGKDGDGIPALVDGKENTYFHSDWGEKVAEAHYLEAVLPNAGYDAFYFKMVSRGASYNHQFPGEVVVTTPNAQPGLYALREQVAAAKALNAYSLPEPGYYIANFNDLAELIIEAEAMLEDGYTDDARAAKAEELKAKITAVTNTLNDKDNSGDAIHMPVANKVYHIISALPGYYEQQRVEKAMTIRGDSALFWENASADSLMQQFELEPVLGGDGYDFIPGEEQEDGSWSEDQYLYWYYLKVVDGTTEHYVSIDSVAQSKQVTVRLSKEPGDTLRLKSLGAGQWNLIADGAAGANQLHTNLHGNGGGKGANIVAWNEGINSGSAWYIREMSELPLTALVSGGLEYESALIRFGTANTLTLKADKACAFADLALYDPYGYEIELDTVLVSGETATVITAHHIVACTFAFSNAEGVTQVEFNAEDIDHTPVIAALEAAYEKALTFNPSVGDSIGQFADIKVFEEALAAAEALLERGTEDKKEVEDAVKALEDAQKALKPNLPEAGKFYFIYSGLDAFEEKKGYDMTLYVDTQISELRWGAENYYNWNRYWEFVPATRSEVKAAAEMFEVQNYDSINTLFFIRNIANEMYIGEGNAPMVTDKVDAMPYAVKVLSGTQIALDGLGLSGKRIHANNHASGNGNGSNIVYYGSGAGSASAWRIVETEYDPVNVEFTEIDDEDEVVVKGIYDLFGRRVETPSAPGIYIIDGKKRLIK